MRAQFEEFDWLEEFRCWACGKPTPIGVCPGPHEEDDWILVALTTDDVSPTSACAPWIPLHGRWKLNEKGTLVCEVTPMAYAAHSEP